MDFDHLDPSVLCPGLAEKKHALRVALGVDPLAMGEADPLNLEPETPEGCHTYNEWVGLGFQVQRGQKSRTRNKEDKATFSPDQVAPVDNPDDWEDLDPWDDWDGMDPADFF